MKKLVKLFLLACVLGFLVGCGSSGGGSDGGGGGGNDKTDNSLTGAQQAYKQLSEYYAAIKSSVSQDFAHRVDYRVHYPVSQSNRDGFVQNLTAEKGFLSSSSDYYNTTTVPLPTDILGAEANISKEGSDYRVRLSITSSKDEAANDTLFEQIFGTIEGNLSDSGFDVVLTGNVTSGLGNAANSSLGAQGFIGTKTDNGWRYVYHTTYYNYYIYYYYNISLNITVINFYFEELTPLIFVNSQGLPSVNIFDYFPDFGGAPTYVDFDIQRYFKDENDAADFMSRLDAQAGCDYTSSTYISCDNNDTNIVNISALKSSKHIVYGYRAYITLALSDIFPSSNAPVVSIKNYYSYDGDLTSQFESYGKMLEKWYGFKRSTTVENSWYRGEGIRSYTWIYSVYFNTNSSSALWDISDTSPVI